MRLIIVTNEEMDYYYDKRTNQFIIICNECEYTMCLADSEKENMLLNTIGNSRRTNYALLLDIDSMGIRDYLFQF